MGEGGRRNEISTNYKQSHGSYADQPFSGIRNRGNEKVEKADIQYYSTTHYTSNKDKNNNSESTTNACPGSRNPNQKLSEAFLLEDTEGSGLQIIGVKEGIKMAAPFFVSPCNKEERMSGGKEKAGAVRDIKNNIVPIDCNSNIAQSTHSHAVAASLSLPSPQHRVVLRGVSPGIYVVSAEDIFADLELFWPVPKGGGGGEGREMEKKAMKRDTSSSPLALQPTVENITIVCLP